MLYTFMCMPHNFTMVEFNGVCMCICICMCGVYYIYIVCLYQYLVSTENANIVIIIIMADHSIILCGIHTQRFLLPSWLIGGTEDKFKDKKKIKHP